MQSRICLLEIKAPIEPIDYLQSDYTDYFAPSRSFDDQFSYSPTGDYLGIAGTPTGMELENMFLARNMGGNDVPVTEPVKMFRRSRHNLNLLVVTMLTLPQPLCILLALVVI